MKKLFTYFQINGFFGTRNLSWVTVRVAIHYFKDFRSSKPKMAKKSSLQTFPLHRFFNNAYHFLKILHKGNLLCRIIVYWSQAFFITSHKANIAFVKLFETSFSSDVIDSLLNFSCQSTATFASAQTQAF